jgi:hypothetical protein
LDIASSNYMKAASRTLPNNITLIPAEHMRTVFGNEAIPSITQGVVYELMTGPNSTPQDLMFAELTSTASYLAPALGLHKIPMSGGRFFLNAITPLDDAVFMVQNALRSTPIIKRLSNKGWLDEDIADLQIRDEVSGALRRLTSDEYRTLKHMKDKFKLLSPETQKFIMTQNDRVDGYLESIVKGLRKSNPELANEIKNTLSLNFAQMSGIAYYQALGRKTSGQLALQDITKVTPRFKQSLKYLEESQKATSGQALILEELNSLFVRAKQEGGLEAGAEAAFEGILQVQANVAKRLQEMHSHQTNVLNETFDIIKKQLEDPATLIGKSAQEIDDIIGDMVDAAQITLSPSLASANIQTRNIQTGKFFTKNKEIVNKVNSVYDSAIKGFNSAIKEFNPKLGSVKILEDVARATHRVIDQRNDTVGRLIYSPLKNFESVDSTDLIDKILQLQKTESALDGGKDSFLAAFTGSVHKLFKKSMLEGLLKDPDLVGVPLEEAMEIAGSKLSAIMENDALQKQIRTVYNLEKTDSISMTHYYDFIKNKSGKQFYGEDLALITASFEDLEYLYRFVRDKSIAMEKAGKSMQQISYSNITNDVNTFIMDQGKKLKVTLDDGRESTIADVINTMRFRFQTEVANRKTDQSFFSQGEVLFSQQTPVTRLLETATGATLLNALYSKNPNARLTAASKFKEMIEKEFGIPIYPKEYVDDTGNLRLDIDFDAVDESTGLKLRDTISQNMRYQLDDTTEEGRQGIKLAQTALNHVLNELGTKNYNVIILGETVRLTPKSLKTDGTVATTRALTESFLTDPTGNNPMNNFKTLQSILEFDMTSGSKHILDLDAFVQKETDLHNIMKNNEKARKNVNGYIETLNNRMTRDKNKILAEVDAENLHRNAILKSINQGDGKKLLDSYIDSMPPALDAEVSASVMQQFRSDLDFVIKANPDLKPEDLKRAWSGMLLESLMEKGNYVATEIRTLHGNVVTSRVLEDPIEVMFALERPTTRKIFEELGVDPDHYDALLATSAYMTVVESTKRTVREGGAINVPDPRYTDVGIISRAFNLARGMVSSEYLVVEAGFRIMKDNDIRLMDFLLNDKEAARLLMKIVKGDGKTNLTNMQANLLGDRISAFIVRELGHGDRKLDILEFNDDDQETEDLSFYDRQRKETAERVQEQLGQSVQTGSTII